MKSSFVKVNFVSKLDIKRFRMASNVHDNFDIFSKMVIRASSFPPYIFAKPVSNAPHRCQKKSHLALLLHNTTFNQMGMHSYTMGKYIKAKTPIFTIKGDKNK